MPFAPFSRVAQEILEDITKGHSLGPKVERFQRSTLLALQEAIEAFLVKTLKSK